MKTPSDYLERICLSDAEQCAVEGVAMWALRQYGWRECQLYVQAGTVTMGRCVVPTYTLITGYHRPHSKQLAPCA